MKKFLHELQAIKKILMLHNTDAIDEYLSQITSTEVRRKIWMNIDGIKLQKDLVELSGIAQPSVSSFLDILKYAGLIEYDSRNPPRRLIDYTPASWFKE